MDDDPLLLSFADALTCAFGASVALFLIFVVLVRFDPPSPVPTSGSQSSRSITTSLANDTPGSSSLVILAQSELPDISCATSSVFSIKVEDSDLENVRIWSSETEIWDGATRKGVHCRRVFEVPDGVTPNSQPTLVVNRANLELIEMRVHLGANAWPAWNKFSRVQIQPSDAISKPWILRVTGLPDMPVITPEDR